MIFFVVVVVVVLDSEIAVVVVAVAVAGIAVAVAEDGGGRDGEVDVEERGGGQVFSVWMQIRNANRLAVLIEFIVLRSFGIFCLSLSASLLFLSLSILMVLVLASELIFASLLLMLSLSWSSLLLFLLRVPINGSGVKEERDGWWMCCFCGSDRLLEFI